MHLQFLDIKYTPQTALSSLAFLFPGWASFFSRNQRFMVNERGVLYLSTHHMAHRDLRACLARAGVLLGLSVQEKVLRAMRFGACPKSIFHEASKSASRLKESVETTPPVAADRTAKVGHFGRCKEAAWQASLRHELPRAKAVTALFFDFGAIQASPTHSVGRLAWSTCLSLAPSR